MFGKGTRKKASPALLSLSTVLLRVATSNVESNRVGLLFAV